MAYVNEMKGSGLLITSVSINKIIEELDFNKVHEKQVIKETITKEVTINFSRTANPYIAFLTSGVCVTYLDSPFDHQRRVLEFLVDKAVLGLEMITKDEIACSKFTQIQKGATVVFIELEYLLNYLSIRPSFSEFLMKYIIESEKRLSRRLFTLSNFSRRKKVLSAFIELIEESGIEREGEWFILPKGIKSKDLINFCNVDKSFFYKMMQEFFFKGILQYTEDQRMKLHKQKLQTEILQIN
ncbi:Crp/Fnr family transcriptional regulator [Listeria kieliensis]|uniref:Crp/Fnr family transcriptional regulator n=1 Tax=Listeria kieliensis TaxID=1621700 RepID=A0A3D8TTE5_9LIST|nr:Crp/Fnr family transcriptional regulator [Listeria kieliensis]RDX02250.1 hypothetical protein UR08_01605 [Listeria kieliensis]